MDPLRSLRPRRKADAMKRHSELRSKAKWAHATIKAVRAQTQDDTETLARLEGVWRQGDARGMRTRERAAMLESCCVLRARLQLVVFMYVPAHRGISLNAYADAAAKAHRERIRRTRVPTTQQHPSSLPRHSLTVET